jgi:hypothetical protein
MDNRFPVLESQIGHIEPIIFNISHKHLQIVFPHFIIMMFPYSSKLTKIYAPSIYYFRIEVCSITNFYLSLTLAYNNNKYFHA